MVGLIKKSALFGLSIALCGCAFFDGPVVQSTFLGAYSLSHRNALIGLGGRVEVEGNPFVGAKSDLDLVVANTLRTSHFGGPFKLSDETVTGSPYRVVLAFNADPILGSRSLCDQEPGLNGVSADGRVNVHAAFCSGKRLLSSTRGHVEARDLSDPNFRELVSMIGFGLFPPVDDRSGDRGGDFLL